MEKEINNDYVPPRRAYLVEIEFVDGSAISRKVGLESAVKV